MNLQNSLKPIPQPYKRWIGRPLALAFIAVLLPVAAAIDAFDWLNDIVEREVVGIWREIADW
jgi:hypothetical protein